jgi:hypothetical protein
LILTAFLSAGAEHLIKQNFSNARKRLVEAGANQNPPGRTQSTTSFALLPGLSASGMIAANNRKK